MSKDSKTTPKKANLMVHAKKDSSLITLSQKSLEDSNFTLVSYAKKNRAGTACSQKNNETPFEYVTMWQFKVFQQKIAPILQLIVNGVESKDHPFIQNWPNATTGSNKITVNSTFRMVAKVLNLQDIMITDDFYSYCTWH